MKAAQVETGEAAQYSESIRYRNKEQNETTKLPPDEEIILPCVWITECYPPSLIEALFLGLERLGWLVGNHRHQNRDIVGFVQGLRSGFLMRGSYNLGSIVPPGTRNWGRVLTAALPAGVRFADAKILQLTPSTTTLCMSFHFEEQVAREIEEPLRADFQTYKEPIPRGYRIHTPRDRRNAAVRSSRAYLTQGCAQWVSEHLPGIFSHDGAPLPAVELLLLREHQPFQRDGEGRFPEFFFSLGLDRTWETWTSRDLPGLYLTIGSHESTSAFATLTGRIRDFSATNQSDNFGPEAINRLLESLEYSHETWATLAVHQLATHYECSICLLRDIIASVEVDQGEIGLSQLADVNRRLLGLKRNAIPFAKELASASRTRNLYLADVMAFDPLLKDKGLVPVFNWIIDHLSEVGQRILESQLYLDAMAQSTSNILSSEATHALAQSNARLQRGLFILTLAMFVLTIVLVWGTPGIREWLLDLLVAL